LVNGPQRVRHGELCAFPSVDPTVHSTGIGGPWQARRTVEARRHGEFLDKYEAAWKEIRVFDAYVESR
jgi:hypothetical protein